jgi:hypothetical protein
MLRRVALVRNEDWEELIASIISVTRINDLGTMLAVTSNRKMLQRNTNNVKAVFRSPILVNLKFEAIHSSETAVLTRAA